MVWLLLLVQVGDAGAGDWLIERNQAEIAVSRGTPIHLINLWGDLRLRSGDPGQLQLFLVGQRHRDDPLPLILDKKMEGDALVVEVVPQGRNLATQGQKWQGKRLDLSLFVPPDSPMVLLTDSGLIESKGLQASLSASSQSGSLRIITGAAVQLQTNAGDVFLRFTGQPAPGLAGSLSLVETVNGSIQVLLPETYSPGCQVTTEYEISSDFSMQVVRDPGRRQKQARIGGEPVSLVLKSINGAIKVLSDD
jgi:hypothetical protein